MQRRNAAESLVCARGAFPHGLQATKGSELRSQRGPAPPADACQPQTGVWTSFYTQRFHLGKLFVYLIFVNFFENIILKQKGIQSIKIYAH